VTDGTAGSKDGPAELPGGTARQQHGREHGHRGRQAAVVGKLPFSATLRASGIVRRIRRLSARPLLARPGSALSANQVTEPQRPKLPVTLAQALALKIRRDAITY
jgi:hypothetical protein